MHFIELSHISHNYQDKFVLNDFSVAISPGKTTCLIGPTGCGKTTVLRLVAGLEPPSAGTITINYNIVSEAGRIIVPPHQRNIGYVFQDLALWPHFTVRENIAFGLKARKEKNISNRIGELLDLFRISDKTDKYPHQLSGGQKQLVAIARSIALQPDILLMDEPLANIDTHVKQNILEHVMQLQQRLNFTMLYVTHNHREAFQTGDIIVVMNEGKMVLKGTKDEIINSSDRFIKSFLEN